ncbi:MAG: hypothetical protein J5606_02470 [Bacteroidales bacterium]|nr:hypothetical protein [Bacteroidales bacterium]
MENIEIDKIGQDKQQRPSMLLVLCILTIINNGFSILSGMMYYVLYNKLPAMLETFSETMSEKMLEINGNENIFEEAVNLIINTPRIYYLLLVLVAVLAIVGAVYMLKLKKLGFHFYIVSQILVLALPMIFISVKSFSFGGFVISALFVYLYSKHLKIMD